MCTYLDASLDGGAFAVALDAALVHILDAAFAVAVDVALVHSGDAFDPLVDANAYLKQL